MKAKILGFFCSLLILATAKGQTIDNVLYTNFNNYYKWRGGAFDSAFLLPQSAATNGKRAGALRYSSADSSVYSWTGSQWVKVGATTDTTSLSNRINLKVNISDTAAMLSPYLRSNVAAATYIDSVYISSDTLRFRKNNVVTSGAPTDTATVVKALVRNAEAVTITKGQVVYLSGASGDKASVRLASNLNDSLSARTFGIVRADIAAGQDGWITTQGQVTGINLGAYTEGDVLWLDSVAGGFTKTRPTAPKHGVFIGIVERANAGNGILYVKVQNGQELEELHDVKITSPTDKQILAYTSSTGIWENKTIDSSYFNNQFATQVRAAQNNASGGVAWTDVDSSLASNWVLNGFHEVDETIMRGSAANNPGLFPGSKYRGTGNWAGSVEEDVNYLIGSTVTSATAVASIGYWDGNGLYPIYVPSSNWFIYTTRVRIPTLNDGTQKFYVNIGVLNAVPSASLSEGVGFLYDLDGTTTGSSASANWQTYSTNNSTRTFNQNHTGVAVAANTWTKLKIVFNSTTAYYYVDNVLIATHTSNIPAGDAIAPFNAIIKTAGIVARTYNVDYQTIDIKYSTPR